MKGKILIATPFLGDKNFERSVILICEHSNQGAFGLIMNQLTNLRLDDVVENIYGDFDLQLGGPVEQNSLHYIHTLGEEIEGSIKVADGVYWSGNFEQIKTFANIGKLKEKDIKFFIGYAGWGENQLEKELKQDSWIISHLPAHLLFEIPAKEAWREFLRRMGGEFKALSNYPTDPRLN